MGGIYDFSADTLIGEAQSLGQFRERVILIVNTASKCGFTPQYKGLEALYRARQARGFVVLGFPCNQFAGQEPGSAAEIEDFCTENYQVTFPMFAKVEVNGDHAHPLFEYLKQQKPGLMGSRSIKWNFTKFLIDRSGQVIARFAPTTAPEALTSKVDELLDWPS